MKVFKIWCVCGKLYGVTEVQMGDFDVGICGFFVCPSCKKILLPARKEVNCLIEEVEIEGSDPGWSVPEWKKRLADIHAHFGKNNAIVLIIPEGIK